MAISPIAPISNATSFIQAALSPRLLTPAQAFAQVLETSVSGPPTAPAALAGARPGEFASALEQALFRDLVSTRRAGGSVHAHARPCNPCSRASSA